MTSDKEVKDALVRHARRVRDVPPYNHDMESYLSLLLGYELTGEPSFLKEAKNWAQYLKTETLTLSFDEYENQMERAESLESVSNLPDDKVGFRPAIWKISNGLRVFGWTHIYNLPYSLHWMENEDVTIE